VLRTTLFVFVCLAIVCGFSPLVTIYSRVDVRLNCIFDFLICIYLTLGYTRGKTESVDSVKNSKIDITLN
jgi:hypothetical protein